MSQAPDHRTPSVLGHDHAIEQSKATRPRCAGELLKRYEVGTRGDGGGPWPGDQKHQRGEMWLHVVIVPVEFGLVRPPCLNCYFQYAAVTRQRDDGHSGSQPTKSSS